MKILLVSSGSGSRGGGEIFLSYLAQGLVKRGHEVLLWMPLHPRMDELAEKCSHFARVIRANYRNTYDHLGRSLSTRFNWLTSRRIAEEWKGLDPDIIHLNKQNLEDGLDLLRAARHCAMPSICTIHLTQNARYLGAKAARLRNWIARNALCKYGGTIVAVQETRRAALEEFVGRCARTRAIFNGVPLPDSEELRSLREAKRLELGLNNDDLLVLGLGRLVEQKRPSVFLELARKLNGQLPMTKFLWVGDGKFSQQWDEWVARAKLGDVISRTGWQFGVLPFLAAADLLLHVAKYEGLPLAIIEAMAARVPCAVTSDLAREFPLFDAKNVLFVDNGLPFVEKLRDRGALATIASNARQLVEDRLSLEAMTASYEQLYRSVLRE
jgi:glycosyltransferase involved in cell wall biosynthesis